MEFFLPSDIFAFEQPLPRSTARCGNANATATPFFAAPLIDAIRQQEVAQARAEAIQRAKAARRRAQEEREARAHLEHLLQLQQRKELLRRQQEAHRQQQLRQHQLYLERQRQQQLQQQAAAREEYLCRQQYAEYQRRKAHAIEQERRRIAAVKEAEGRSRHIFLALGDLLFGGPVDHNEGQLHQSAGCSRSPKQVATPVAAPGPKQQQQQQAQPAQDVKGKGKAQAEADEDDDAMDLILEHLFGTPTVETAQPSDKAATDSNAMAVDEDPEEVGPTPAEAPIAAGSTTTTNHIEEKPASPVVAPQEKKNDDVLVFHHTFPSGNSKLSNAIQANDIKISVNEQTNKVTVAGLWDDATDDASTSPASIATRPSSPTHSTTSSQKGRSRSPKRARVSDVDANGEEIVRNDEEDDEYVKLSDDDVKSSASSVSSASSRTAPLQVKKVEKTFDLPAGAKAEDLRAELTDDGLRLWVSTRA